MARLRRQFAVAVLGGLLGVTVAAQTASRPALDLAGARDEAVRVLQDLIRLDTTNPPGNETRAARYLKQALDKEGIPSEILELEPGRGNLVARLKGNGRKRPVLILGHTDVVGAERERWSVDPLSGTLRDGFVYGRGAEDDKDTVAAGLVAFLTIHRQRLPLDRDVIFLAEAGEEGTARVGITFMVEQHWDKIDAEFALAEGGRTAIVDGRVKYVGVATTEKVPRRFRLVARGTPGHGSVPRSDNALTRLSAAVAKIGAWQPPMRLNETTRAFFQRLATISPPQEASVYRDLLDPAGSDVAQAAIRRDFPVYNSMLRTSIVPTIMKGGVRSNVIPGEAEAGFDVRALPDEDMDRLVAEITRLIDDPGVEIVREPAGRPSSPPSRLDTDLFRALERAQQAMFPGAATLPMMLTGATDNAQLRARGVQAYGIGAPSAEGTSGAHGDDERIAVEALGQYVELIHRVIVDVAGAR